MIQAINLRQLRNSEFIRFHKQVLEICEKANPASLAIAPQVNNLYTQVTQLDALFVKRGNPITEELETLDDRRDAALMGIRANLDSFAYHYEPAVQAAANAVLSVINKYGSNLPRLGYSAETEVIDNIADDLKDSNLSAAVQTLGIADWLKELTTANTAFNTRFLAHNTEYAAQPDGNMKEQRLEAMEAYGKLVEHIAAHAVITPTDAYKKLASEIDSLAGQYNFTLSIRAGSEEEPPENPSSDAPAKAA